MPAGFAPVWAKGCYLARVAPPDDDAPSKTPSSPAPGAAAASEPSAAPRAHPKDPLHGVTLQQILEELHAKYGWEGLGRFVQVRCFTHDPSMGSSLAFLRRTPWARSEVEALYIRSKRGAGPRR